MRPITITHDKYEDVEGVEVLFKCTHTTWGKNGAEYTEARGWREKVPQRWVEDSTYLNDCEARGCLSFLTTQPLPPDKRWKAVDRYVLPEGWDPKSSVSPSDLKVKPCLIIERKVPKWPI